jgi:hypothetical protein
MDRHRNMKGGRSTARLHRPGGHRHAGRGGHQHKVAGRRRR